MKQPSYSYRKPYLITTFFILVFFFFQFELMASESESSFAVAEKRSIKGRGGLPTTDQVVQLIDSTHILGLGKIGSFKIGDLVSVHSKYLSERRLGLFRVKRILEIEPFGLGLNDDDAELRLEIDKQKEFISKNKEAPSNWSNEGSNSGETYIEPLFGREYVVLEIFRGSREGLVRPGDQIFKVHLDRDDLNYPGNTDLLLRSDSRKVAARYKYLVSQGNSIGETAETLWRNEWMMSFNRLADDPRLISSAFLHYGLTSRLMFGSRLSALPRNPNLSLKLKFYEGTVNSLATGFTLQKNDVENAETLNLNFMWDSISSQTTISHTYLSVALRNDLFAEDDTIIKSIGTSNIQTGYEFLLDSWSRVLVGPNYNVERKILGGYLSYLMIWEHLHLQMGVHTSNFQSFKLKAEDGYSPFVEMHWRF